MYIAWSIFVCFLCSFTLSQVYAFDTVENGMQAMLSCGVMQYDSSQVQKIVLDYNVSFLFRCELVFFSRTDAPLKNRVPASF